MSKCAALIGLLSHVEQIEASARALIAADANSQIDTIAETVAVEAERMHETINKLILDAGQN
jgi:hypothetical protein